MKRTLHLVAEGVHNFYLDEGSGIFYVRRMINGQIVERSTRTTDHEVGYERYIQIMRELDARKAGPPAWESVLKGVLPPENEPRGPIGETTLTINVNGEGHPIRVELRVDSPEKVVALDPKATTRILRQVFGSIEGSQAECVESEPQTANR